MGIKELLWPVVILASSVLIGDVLTFEPGCSFVGDKCQYTVKLGHEGSCDASGVGTGSSGGQTACCDDLIAKYSKLTDDLEKLTIRVNTVSKALKSSHQNMTLLEDEIKATLKERDDVLTVLGRKETELNSTKAELSKVMGKAATEIKNLRDTLAARRTSLDTCQKALGLTGGKTGTGAISDDGDYDLTYYNFKTLPKDFAMNTIDSVSMGLMRGGSSLTTGPRVEHSTGTRKGSYLGLDASSLASSSRSKTTKYFRAETTTFPPADDYCVMFWYYMRGINVKTLSVNLKINTGTGYPIYERKGQSLSDQWQLARLDIDSEYSSSPFKIVFGMSSDAYNENVYTYGRRHNQEMNALGDIAIDDLYVYNTTCSNIPRYPQGAYKNTVGNVTSFYTFHSTPATWENAYETCRRASPWSALVSIESATEQSYLVSTIKHDVVLSAVGQGGFYTSGTDNDQERTFVWTSTGLQRVLTSTSWHSGQPNNVAGDQDCLLMEYPSSDYQWGDVNCHTKHPFICEVVEEFGG